MMKCPEECRKQWRLKQGKSGWQKQKEEEAREKVGKKQEAKAEKKTGINSAKRHISITTELERNMINIKRIAEE